MANTFDKAFGRKLSAARAESDEHRQRRDLVNGLRASGGRFAPPYTIMQRIEDGARPIRIGELAAVVEVLQAPVDSLIPTDMDVAELTPGRGKGTARSKYQSESEEAALQITLQQLVGLASALDISFTDLYARMAEVARSRGDIKGHNSKPASTRSRQPAETPSL